MWSPIKYGPWSADAPLHNHNKIYLTLCSRYWMPLRGSSMDNEDMTKWPPLLRELHWLHVPERITFRLATLAYRCQHNMVPHYLAIQLHQASSVASRQWLRSAWTPELIFPCTSRSTIGDHAFCVTAARVWNTLTPSVLSLSLLQFFDVVWSLNCSRAPSQTNYFSERSMLSDSVYFTTLKSLDYNVVMTFRFDNNNNKQGYSSQWCRPRYGGMITHRYSHILHDHDSSDAWSMRRRPFTCRDGVTDTNSQTCVV